MKKLNEKYADGRWKYLVNCSKCGAIESCVGRPNSIRKCKECKKKERSRRMMGTKRHTTHGLTNHPLYKKWEQTKNRCYRETYKEYKYWGGRGIKMYEPWKKDPTEYIKYLESLPHAYEDGRSIDRVHNDYGYEPMNLRWATAEEQANNKRPRKTNTGEKYISFDKNIKRYRVKGKGPVFKTLQEAIKYRDFNPNPPRKEEYAT